MPSSSELPSTSRVWQSCLCSLSASCPHSLPVLRVVHSGVSGSERTNSRSVGGYRRTEGTLPCPSHRAQHMDTHSQADDGEQKKGDLSVGLWGCLPLAGPDWPLPAVPCASESPAMTGNTGCVFSDTVTDDIPWSSALTGCFSQEFSVFLLSRLLSSQEILEAVTFFWGNYCLWDRNLSILWVMVRHFPKKNPKHTGTLSLP